jgi:hypothetical protein
LLATNAISGKEEEEMSINEAMRFTVRPLFFWSSFSFLSQ